MKKLLQIIIIAALFTFQFSQETYAQLSTLSKNDSIRITAPAFYLYPLVGKFEKLKSDSLYFEISSSSLAIPIRDIEKIEFPIIKRNVLPGILIGAIVGGFLLGTLAESSKSNCNGEWCGLEPDFIDAFPAGVLLGGGLGAIIGYAIKTEDWEEIPIDR